MSYSKPFTFVLCLLLSTQSAYPFIGNGVRMMGHTAGSLMLLAGSLDGAGNSNATGTNAKFHNPYGLGIDSSGNVYVADTGSNAIREITPAGVVTTFAGRQDAGSFNATGTAASFNAPLGVTVDSSDNAYVADTSNNLIRKITSAGVVTTLAGSGSAGSTNGTGTAASFNNPSGVAVDSSGNVYVADTGNNLIRKITSAGVVTTFAGMTTAGHANGTGTSATFSGPHGITIDSSSNLYVADTSNNMIRKISSAAVVTTLAGSTTAGSTNATGTSASFNGPTGVTVDTSGNVYVADAYNELIRKITSAGVVTTLAGSGSGGSANGTGTAASFNSPNGIVVDTSGNVYVGDQYNLMIRKITAAGVVTTLAGSVWNNGFTNGTGSGACFNLSTIGAPSHLVADTSGNIYIADTGNNVIRKVTSAGVVTTFAGSGVAGYLNGTGVASSFNAPRGIGIDTSGNLYVADTDNNVIRKITSAGVVTTFAGSGVAGHANGTGTAATFSSPYGLTVDSSGNVYVADTGSNEIRKITSAGVVTLFAGSSSGTAGFANGTGAAAEFNQPMSVTVDSSGNVYVADTGNNIVRKITSAGAATILAGNGGWGTVNGAGTSAEFEYPVAVAVDSSGNVYVADYSSCEIRKITSAGFVTTVVGNIVTSAGNVLGPLPASLYNVIGVTLYGGYVYISVANAIVYAKAL
jgi:sugar lactone lactonase YvrE